jgi:hypothetical protein
MSKSHYFHRSKKNKYNARSVEYDGLKFDSQREALRYKELTFLISDGIISNLRRQVKYVLIPAQREPSTVGPRGGVKPGKLLEKECSYIADFVYTVVETGETVVEDTKGFRTKDYLIKRKLMLFVYGIKIKEI